MRKCYRLIHDDKRQECITDNPKHITCTGCLEEIGIAVIKALTKEKLDKILEEAVKELNK